MNVEQHKRAWLIYILQRCWIVLAVVSTAFHPCEAQHTIPTASKSCQPVIRVAHATISCFDLKNSNNVQTPTIDTPCGDAINSLTYQDTYYELASQQTSGFAGYFDLSQWEKKSGDGGVDVTGAPNGILVEGANIAKVSVAPQQETILRIVIPAEGFVTFDWKSIGGSNLLFETLINAQTSTVRNKGFYRTSLLHLGDTLTLRFNASETLEVQFSNFKFYTNAAGVTVRHWTATTQQKQQYSFDQLICVKRPSISSIIFPNDSDNQELLAAPNATGFPILDEDGDFKTLNDQRILDKNDCGFNVSWEDKVVTDDKGSSIIRHWTIQDAYNGNVVEHTQQIQATDINFNAVPQANIKQTIQVNNSNANNKSAF